MDNNLLIVILIAGIGMIISYLFAKSIFEKKLNEYKKSINSKLSEYKSLDEALSQTQEQLAIIQSERNEDAIELNNVRAEITELQKRKENAEQLLEDVKNELNDETNELALVRVETVELQELKKNEKQLLENVQFHTITISKLKVDEEKLILSISKLGTEQEELMGMLDLYSRLDEFTSCGHFEIPDYLYETSIRFTEEIKDVREQQKDMIKDKNAITYPATTIISNDKSFNKKILDGQVKLMLTAFNTECDFLIGKVSPSSFGRTLERIEKLANTLEKSAATLECGFDISYVELKFEECKLQYQYTLKKQEEVAEQKLIKEQIREEQRAIKEYERAIAEAEKEEKMYRDLLDIARKELSGVSENERAVAELRIAQLELQLLEAEAKESRAKSMAEQTRKGHVYVISNIGSFGEDVYKIGMTRRLEPMDRVKELGDASVPFPFDVHAMIYAEDAPALETALHRKFTSLRVNAVNLRKEFFQVDLDSIKEAVDNIDDMEVEFKMTALAEDYYESLRLQERLAA
jgi:chromosome segregation ATPase